MSRKTAFEIYGSLAETYFISKSEGSKIVSQKSINQLSVFPYLRLTFLEGSRITISSSSSDSKPKLLNLDGFTIFLPDLEVDMMLTSDF